MINLIKATYASHLHYSKANTGDCYFIRANLYRLPAFILHYITAVRIDHATAPTRQQFTLAPFSFHSAKSRRHFFILQYGFIPFPSYICRPRNFCFLINAKCFTYTTNLFRFYSSFVLRFKLSFFFHPSRAEVNHEFIRRDTLRQLPLVKATQVISLVDCSNTNGLHSCHVKSTEDLHGYFDFSYLCNLIISCVRLIHCTLFYPPFI